MSSYKFRAIFFFCLNELNVKKLEFRQLHFKIVPRINFRNDVEKVQQKQFIESETDFVFLAACRRQLWYAMNVWKGGLRHTMQNTLPV